MFALRRTTLGVKAATVELHSIYHKSNTNCGERGKVKWVSLSLSTPLEKVEGSRARTEAPSIVSRKRQFWVFNQATTACLDCHLVEKHVAFARGGI